jgi:hypothetical protein
MTANRGHPGRVPGLMDRLHRVLPGQVACSIFWLRAVAVLLKDHGAAQNARVEVPDRATLRTVMNMVTMSSAGAGRLATSMYGEGSVSR